MQHGGSAEERGACVAGSRFLVCNTAARHRACYLYNALRRPRQVALGAGSRPRPLLTGRCNSTRIGKTPRSTRPSDRPRGSGSQTCAFQRHVRAHVKHARARAGTRGRGHRGARGAYFAVRGHGTRRSRKVGTHLISKSMSAGVRPSTSASDGSALRRGEKTRVTHAREGGALRDRRATRPLPQSALR